MGDERNSYDKAIDVFEGLLAKPIQQELDGPLPLARSVGLAATSGYRAVAAAETEGLLTRSTEGAYLRGISTLTIGLSALEFGEFALIAKPVLLQLRQASRLTAFIAVLTRDRCLIGPFSTGRGASYALPKAHYQLSSLPAWDDNELAGVSLSTGDDAVAAQKASIALVSERDGRTCIVGVFWPNYRQAGETPLREDLLKAARLLSKKAEAAE